LIAHAQARYMAWHQELRNERDLRLQNLHSLNLEVAGRAFHRFKIYEELLIREVKEKIKIYKAVADEHSAVELLSKPRLDELREEIMTSVNWACMALRDHNEGDRTVDYPGPFPEPNRYEALKGIVLSVVVTELAVLETEGRLLGPKQVEAESVIPREIEKTLDQRTTKLERHENVEAFLLKCNAQPSVKIIEKHIWRAVGHTTARQFQYWKVHDRRATQADNRNFTRILSMQPSEFVALLKAKQIL
jgi:hypothetical protein